MTRCRVQFRLFLQKQRAFWRTVVHFNVVQSLKVIIRTLAGCHNIDSESGTNISQVNADNISSVVNGSLNRGEGEVTTFMNLPFVSSSTSSFNSPQLIASPLYSPIQLSSHQLTNLCSRLSPLLAVEEQLAMHLERGITIPGFDQDEVSICNDRQTYTIWNGGLTKGRQPNSGIFRDNNNSQSVADSPLLEDSLLDSVANMLEASKEDIKSLWEHPIVVALITNKKLKLKEWSKM